MTDSDSDTIIFLHCSQRSVVSRPDYTVSQQSTDQFVVCGISGWLLNMQSTALSNCRVRSVSLPSAGHQRSTAHERVRHSPHETTCNERMGSIAYMGSNRTIKA